MLDKKNKLTIVTTPPLDYVPTVAEAVGVSPSIQKTKSKPKPAKPKIAVKPLVILLTPEMRDDPTAQRQVAGHTVIYTDELLVVPDVIMGQTAWRILPETRKFMEVAIREARKIKYPKEDEPA